jgi:hypothetical protein
MVNSSSLLQAASKHSAIKQQKNRFNNIVY